MVSHCNTIYEFMYIVADVLIHPIDFSLVTHYLGNQLFKKDLFLFINLII